MRQSLVKDTLAAPCLGEGRARGTTQAERQRWRQEFGHFVEWKSWGVSRP